MLIESLESELAGARFGIVLISHDRRLLERFSRTTVWLDRGITRALDQGFGDFEPWRDAILPIGRNRLEPLRGSRHCETARRFAPFCGSEPGGSGDRAGSHG